MRLNTTAAATAEYTWTTPFNAYSTQLVFYQSRTPDFSTGTSVAYLFATKSGISKVGTYNGTGSNTNIGNQNIDCGFTAGARFVLIKRTDSTGDWYIWDSTRGITTSGGGNDPHLSLNSTAAEVTTDDSIDTYISGSNSGFTVKQNATTNLNLFVLTTGSTYIYLAIA